ncbi:MotA/TolQ/ExbB proton channel family protein [Limnohabitans planktonicus]|uniref:Biopolymer transport protein ExbB n=1 Tax=Limnohabitans planktonicus II-D5 TaxID=1293045 RepID=A0A2T7UE79_9BURK|nr:MotA/TolQ/ExbB proton channel family protein [Limnohabitans planktonicus]PVE42918.1 biopolymer transporter ExbB [Limnohabitans planktonicus II-D5]|eukprot:gene39611-48942_t
MFKRLKQFLWCAGLVASVLTADLSLAAKPKEASAAAPAASTAPADMAPAAATTVPPITPTESVVEENPYGLAALWAQGDFVAKSTLLILVIMSMGSWYVIFTKFAEQSKLHKQAAAAQQTFWSASTVAQGKDTLAPDSAFRFIAEKGLEGASKHTGLLGAVDLNEWITMSIQRAMGHVQNRMQDGLAVLATVGSTAPFVGLFGTVWGIYHALVKIGMSGQASIDKVAGPVGEALIMTAIGLAVAVPAVLGYNFLVRRNKAVMEQVNAFGADLHAVLLGSAKK